MGGGMACAGTGWPLGPEWCASPVGQHPEPGCHYHWQVRLHCRHTGMLSLKADELAERHVAPRVVLPNQWEVTCWTLAMVSAIEPAMVRTGPKCLEFPSA
eukprot:365611-Chlamydomonas_euryale.AAC.23